MTTTSLTDIHPDIIQTHILPRLDGPSLSTAATASSHLNHLCSDHRLWSHISRSTWPSITHPRLHSIISAFPAGHRSFFDDSFPTLITDANHRTRRPSRPSPKPNCPSYHLHSLPSELISAVDIHYRDDVVYSTVEFTETTSEFLSAPVRVELNRPGSISRPIHLTVDEMVGADGPTLSHLKASLTLSWILINPVHKRACNLSSVKPVSARGDWVTNETHVRYVTVLPGCDPNEMVQCKTHVVLGVGERGLLKVTKVMLTLQDLDSCSLNGLEFLVVTEATSMEENNVRRRVVDDDWRLKSYAEFKEMKKEQKLVVKQKQRRREVAVNYFGFVVSLICLLVALYFLSFGFFFILSSVLIAIYVYVDILE